MKKVLDGILKAVCGIVKFIIRAAWGLVVGITRVILVLMVIMALLEKLLGIAGVIGPVYLMAQFKNQGDILGAVIFCLIMFVIPVLVQIINFGYVNRCPVCHKWYALKKNGEELIESKDIQIRAEVKRKDNYGHVIGTQEQYVPGTRNTFHKNYICRRCGEASYRTYTKDVKNV